MNFDKHLTNTGSPTQIAIETVSDYSIKKVTQKDINRYSREFNCEKNTVLLFKREKYLSISEHEIIACHFLSDVNLDRHLDRLQIGCRVKTNGHSKWLFPRSLSPYSKSLSEMYFTENFLHFFSHVVDLDTEAVFDVKEFTKQRREDLMYKLPLETKALVYCSDLLKVIEPFYQDVAGKLDRIELTNDSGQLSDVKNIYHKDDSLIHRGTFETFKPHMLVAVHWTETDKLNVEVERFKLILMDTDSLRVVGIYGKEYQPERRNFFMVITVEDEDFKNRNDIITE